MMQSLLIFTKTKQYLEVNYVWIFTSPVKKKINQLLYSCNKTITDMCYGLYKDLSIQETLYLQRFLD
jgi:hypothetical protein